tara:strand:- start:60 stop:164 length:105 start_codon:yes stop_codon:yes gene_type:complete
MGKWKHHVTPTAKKNEIKHPSKEEEKNYTTKLSA